MSDIHDISDLENEIHDKFDQIDYENLTKGERARLRQSLKTLNMIVDRILSGYYKKVYRKYGLQDEVRSLKETGHTVAEIAEELKLGKVEVRPMKEAANGEA